jgi:hypothetical protein
MDRSEECQRCGGLEDFLYQIGETKYYYCFGCQIERRIIETPEGIEQRFTEQDRTCPLAGTPLAGTPLAGTSQQTNCDDEK